MSCSLSRELLEKLLPILFCIFSKGGAKYRINRNEVEGFDPNLIRTAVFWGLVDDRSEGYRYYSLTSKGLDVCRDIYEPQRVAA